MTTQGLVELTAKLMAIPSVSRNEVEIANWTQQFLSNLPWLEVTRFKNSIIARTMLGRSERVLMAGHLDTVPPAGNEQPVVDDSGLFGLGSCDMKGGLAVMLLLAKTHPKPGRDLTFILYSGEEIERSANELRMLAEKHRDLLECDVAILCEPTNSRVEAGCQGSIRMQVIIRGTRAHSARPWMGKNAIHLAAPLISLLGHEDLHRVPIDGCEFIETSQAVGIQGGVAGNVVPDEVRVTINSRFAPDKTLDQAIELLRSRFISSFQPGDIVEVSVEDATPGAPPNLSNPLLKELVEISSQDPVAKLGLTDVSLFAELGIAATNFGPGDSGLAHSPKERVENDDLFKSHECLSKFIDPT